MVRPHVVDTHDATFVPQGVAVDDLVLPGSALKSVGPLRIGSIAIRHASLSISNTVNVTVDGVDVQLHQPRMPQVCRGWRLYPT